MIYLKQGEVKPLWFSLRESTPIGSTNSFSISLTNDISGESKTYKPTDLQLSNKWSRFSVEAVQTLQLQNLNIGKVYLVPGMWSYTIMDDYQSIILETGKVLVEEGTITPTTTLTRPAKSKVVLRR